MRRIYAILLILITTNVYGQDCLDMDIILLGDYSGSIEGKEHYVKNAFEAFSKSFKYSASVRIGIILFDGSQYIVCPLISSRNTSEVMISMDKYVAGGETILSTALEFSFDMLMADSRNTEKTIIIISDGQANDERPAKKIAEQIKSKGVLICSIHISQLDFHIMSNPNAINKNWGREIMKNISSGDQYFTTTNYTKLSNTLKELSICM